MKEIICITRRLAEKYEETSWFSNLLVLFNDRRIVPGQGHEQIGHLGGL